MVKIAKPFANDDWCEENEAEFQVFDFDISGTKQLADTFYWRISDRLDIGRNVCVTYEQRKNKTLMDRILDTSRFQPMSPLNLLYLKLDQFYATPLNEPTPKYIADTKQWHFNLVAAGRRSFKKL